MRNHEVCDLFNIIMEEKNNRHFHIWIMPRYEWMKEVSGNITQNIGKVFDYAKSNFRTQEVYDRIQEVSDIVKNSINKENIITLKVK